MASLLQSSSSFAEVSERDLDINDHDIVYDKVKRISAKWMLFAGSLHLEQDRIDIIERDHGRSSELCMSMALRYWLRRKNYNSKRYGVPCWRLVCMAVKEGGDDPALAEEIAHEYHARGLRGVGSQKMYVPSERNSELVDKLFNLRCEFSNALYKTKKYFQQESLSDIIDYLDSHIIKLLGPQRSNRPGTVIKEFQSAQTISELFSILQHKYLSWFNYELIIELVKKFLSTNSELKRIWSCYKKNVNDYFMNNGILLKDAENVQFGEFNSPPPGTKILIAKVDDEDYTLDHLFFLRKALPKELNIPEYDLYFSFVYTSSLYLEYWIPDFLYLLLFPLSEKEKLASIGIIELSCGEYSYNFFQYITETKKEELKPELLREIESKLGDNYDELYCRLAGIDGFSEKMISQNLVVTRSKKFEDIIDEFKILLQSSENGMELLNCYKTFIEVLREFENAHSIIPNLKVPEKKIKSYLSKPIQEHDNSSRRDIDLTKESEEGIEIKLYLKNGLQEIILLRDERFTLKKVLTLKEMKNIILSETISCSFFLATFLSLPFSQKSTLISQFLQRVTYTIPGSLNLSTLIEYNARGVSINSRILLKHQQSKEYLWFAPAQILREALSCGSAILHMSIFYDYKLKIDFDKKPKDGFDEKVLDDYFDRVSQNVKQIVQYGHELQQMLSSRTIFLNILHNYGTNKGVVEFLNLISRHLSNNSGFICLTVSDTEELSDFRHVGSYDSKISCIVNYAIQMHSEVPITFIVICSEKDKENDREKAEQKLFEAVKIETARLGLQLVQPSILVIDPSSSDDFKKLKSILDNEIKRQCFIKKDIKLSWLFLLNALLFSDKIVISYDKLKEMAGKLKIKEMEYIEFLDTFTKSMSILYLPSIVKDFVILRPVEFINQLSTLFKIPYGKEDFNGVYTMEQLSQNKELANVIADILSSLGMALKTTSDKVDKRISALSGQPSTLLYIPLARSGRILEKSFSTSLYIIFDSKLTLPNFLSFFASELLKLRGFSLLTSGDDHKCHPNVLRVLLITSLGHEYIFFFVFHSIHIEVVIDSYREFGLSNVLEKILFCCQEALSKISSIVTKFSFKLALQCLRPDQVHTSKKIFEELSKKQLCHQCETTVSVVRRKWKETIQKIHEDEETRKDKIKTDEILVYAHKLGAHIKSPNALKNFAVQLGVKLEIEFLTTLSQLYSPWQRVFMVLLSLEKKEGAVKKEKIKNALQRLGHPEFLT